MERKRFAGDLIEPFEPRSQTPDLHPNRRVLSGIEERRFSENLDCNRVFGYGLPAMIPQINKKRAHDWRRSKDLTFGHLSKTIIIFRWRGGAMVARHRRRGDICDDVSKGHRGSVRGFFAP